MKELIYSSYPTSPNSSFYKSFMATFQGRPENWWEPGFGCVWAERPRGSDSLAKFIDEPSFHAPSRPAIEIPAHLVPSGTRCLAPAQRSARALAAMAAVAERCRAEAEAAATRRAIGEAGWRDARWAASLTGLWFDDWQDHCWWSDRLARLMDRRAGLASGLLG